MGFLVAIVIALIILSLPMWPYAAAWGYGFYPAVGFVLLLLILLLALVARPRHVS